MILFNITFNVDDDIKSEWLDYMQHEIIPKMLKSNLLHSAVLSELLLNEPQGTSYALQFLSENPEILNRFRRADFPAIKRELWEKYGDKVVFFPTEMKVIKRF